ncbi:hypothetical protein [Halocalculus aciditolerans]|uniref:Uncharacterized protein n=1 Tax=Halocalculus aciditolerans TaxID=1383812 RepID=A0A830FI64_9EURY|nr:hypothetical protein [Halocalculus aciditolerans]GGL58229.1 hypothetical protein GCM10009039_15570 [Halocalculus aciditolerans]
MSSEPSGSGLSDLFVEVTGTDEVVEEQVEAQKRVSEDDVDVAAAADDGLQDAVANGNDDLAAQFD